MIKILVADDEKPKLDFLCELIEKHPRAKVECTASNIDDVEKCIIEYQPQLAFLDVKLFDEPVYMALDRILRKPECRMPEIVFVTGHKDEYAKELIKYDYLKFIQRPFLDKEIGDTIDLYLQRHPNYMNARIAINHINGTHILMPTEIVYCKGDGAYSIIHFVDGSKITATKSIGEIFKLLPSYLFYTVHRSYIVNLSLVSGIDRGQCAMRPFSALIPISNKQELLQRISKLT